MIYVIFLIFQFLLTAGIYGLALWFLVKGAKNFPKKIYFWLVPIFVLLTNLYVMFVSFPSIENLSDQVTMGINYSQTNTPKGVRLFSELRSECGSLCSELLLEKHVDYVIVVGHNTGRRDSFRYELSSDVDFFAQEYPYDSYSNYANHYTSGKKIHTTNNPQIADISISQCPACDQHTRAHFNLNTLHRNDLVIFEKGRSIKDIIAIKGHPKIEKIMFPLYISLLGNKLSFSPEFGTRALTNKERKIQKYIENYPDNKFKSSLDLLNYTLNLNLDGKVDIQEAEAMTLEEAHIFIKKGLESGFRSHMMAATYFALNYDVTAFTSLFQSYENGERKDINFAVNQYLSFIDTKRKNKKCNEQFENGYEGIIVNVDKKEQMNTITIRQTDSSYNQFKYWLKSEKALNEDFFISQKIKKAPNQPKFEVILENGTTKTFTISCMEGRR